METPTPKVVFDRYQSLTEDQKMAFLAHLASISSSKQITYLTDKLPPLVRTELYQMSQGDVIKSMFPLLTRIAFDLVAKTPEIQREEARALMGLEAQKYLTGVLDVAAEVERATIKDQRDRKSDPETVSRNVEICDLRQSDQKLWSHSRLATKFGVTPQNIGLVLKEESKWRQLAGAK